MYRFMILLFLFSFTCCYARPAFRSEKDFPAIGLRFRMLSNGAEPEPMPQPQTYTFRVTRGEESSTLNLFDPHELWMSTQHLGKWRDRNDNVLIIGRATATEPELTPIAEKYVKREDFNKAMSDKENQAIQADDLDGLKKWVSSFTQLEVGTPITIRPSFRMYKAYRFPLPDKEDLFYTVSLKSRQSNGTTVPSDWFCFWLKIDDGSSPETVRKDFESRFLTSIAPLTRGNILFSKRRSQELKTFTPGKRASMKIKASPQRDAIKHSIENMPDWWYAETTDYIFLSNIRSSFGKRLIRSLQTSMEASQEALIKLLPPLTSDQEVHVVRLFEDQEEYKRHTGPDVEWSDGVWSPMRRELTILVKGKEIEDTLRTIRHESFHQYLFYAGAMYEQSMWFNEGHACFCEGMQIKRNRVSFQETDRVKQVERELNAVAKNIPNIISAGREEFYAKDQRQLLLNYTTAWSLIYFLRKGLPTYKGYSTYKKILPTYWSTIAKTHDCKKATEEAFSGISMKRLQNDFMTFWQKRRNSAKRVDPLLQQGSY